MMERFPGIRRVFRIGVPRSELEEELAYHFDRTREELAARGLSPAEAEREARHRFGDERRYRRELRKIDGRAATRRQATERAASALASLRYAVRRIRRAPGFALGVVLIFGLGIGANATMFGILDRLLLSPPPHIAAPDGVRQIMFDARSVLTGQVQTNNYFTYPDFEAISGTTALADVAAYSLDDLTLGRGSEAQPVRAAKASGTFFPLLRTRPLLGRFPGPEDDRQGAPAVVAISHSFWRRQFGGDPGALGKTLDFGHGPYTIIGVAPPGFNGLELERIDLWLPLRPTQAALRGPAGPGEGWLGPGWTWLRLVGRLGPGTTVADVEAQGTVLFRQARAERIEEGNFDAQARLVATSLIQARTPRASSESKVAIWLAGVSLIVLLIACANIANLLLVRALRQQREVGIRLALGSSRSRIMGQVLMESLLLAALGGVAALLVARWAGTLVRRVLLPQVAWGSSAVDGRTMLVILGLSLIAGAAAGLVPAVQSAGRDIREFIGGSSRSVTASGSRLRNGLAATQTALSVVVLVGAGLFVRSLRQVEAVDFGIEPQGVLYVTPVLGEPVGDERGNRVRTDFYRDALGRLPGMPAVASVAAAAAVPFRLMIGEALRVPGRDSLPSLPGGGPYFHDVTPDYFTTLGLDLRRGRGFSETDRGAGAAPVVVISETAARALWPGENPLGQCLFVGDGAETCSEVIGIVEDARRLQIIDEDPAINLYRPLGRDDLANASTLLVRVNGDPADATPEIRRTLTALAPRVRFVQVDPLEEILAPQFRSWRLGASVLTVCGLLALLVAAIGLYGVLAFGVAQRTRELGIRSALGASAARLRGMVVREGMRVVGVGMGAGVLISLAAAPRVRPLLYGVGPRDPLIILTVLLLLGVVALLASWTPAWRATRVDPGEALRAED